MRSTGRLVSAGLIVCLGTLDAIAEEKTTATQRAAASTSQPAASAWSEPSEQGLQTRLVPVTRSVKPGRPVFVQMEVRHKDRKDWAQATTVDTYPAEVLVHNAQGKLVDRMSAGLKFRTVVPPGEGVPVGVFLAGQKTATLGSGTYSVTIEPKTTPEMVKRGMVQLPVAGPLLFRIPPAASSAPSDEPLKPDYEQAEELLAYLKARGGGYPEQLVGQGRSVVPGLVALVEKGDDKVSDEFKLRVWQFAAFIIGDIGDKRAVPFLLRRLDDKEAMDFYFVRPLGELGVKQAVPRLVRELQTMDERSWEVLSSAYGSRATYLVEALEQITGEQFPKDEHKRPTDKDATLKAINAWWDRDGKRLYATVEPESQGAMTRPDR